MIYFLFHSRPFIWGSGVTENRVPLFTHTGDGVYPHLTFTGSERWPRRRSMVWTISSQRQTELTPWIRHLSAELINPERGRMASASVPRDRHWEEGVFRTAPCRAGLLLPVGVSKCERGSLTTASRHWHEPVPPSFVFICSACWL